jgi:small-conductance mechanosensitive channel
MPGGSSARKFARAAPAGANGIFGDLRRKLDQPELVVWSKEMSYRPRRFRSDLNFAIAQKLREAGIEIPYPQRDLHLRDGLARVEMTPSAKTRSARLRTVRESDDIFF